MQSPEVLQIKERLNIADVVGGYIKLQKAGRNWRACCPFHKERSPSFMVSPERGSYMCFGCGEKGDIFSFVEKMDGVDFAAAIKQLAERAGVELPKHSQSMRVTVTPAQMEKADRLREVCDEATAFFEERFLANDGVKKYVTERGVTDETRARWRIGYAPAEWRSLSERLTSRGMAHDDIVDAGLAVRSQKRADEIYDRFRGRIMFPLFDMSGRVIAFSGRFFEKLEGVHEEGEPAKYVNSPETELFKKSKVLYGFDKAKESIRKNDCAMLVEGQFDVVLSHQAGLPFVVAVSGTALTEDHLALLGRFSKRIILAMDNDSAGLKAGLRGSLMALGLGFDVKVPIIEGGKDPADLVKQDPELLRVAVRNATTAIEFFLHALRSVSKDERGYKKLAETHIVPLIAAIKSNIDRAHFVHATADALGVPEDAIRAEVTRVLNTAKPTTAQTSTQQSSATTASAPTQSAPAEEILSLFEKKVAMLLGRFGIESETGLRVVELVGKERSVNIQERSAKNHERLLFEFESLGAEDAEHAKNMLDDLERATIGERIIVARRDLRASEVAHDTAESARLAGLIIKLTREQHHYIATDTKAVPNFLNKK